MSSSGLEPPWLAEQLLKLFARPEERLALIGDLREEFFHQSEGSPSGARRWYWGQALSSLPHLFLLRMHSDTIRQAGGLLVAALAAMVLISLWDIYIARVSARNFASASENAPVLTVRTVYFAVQLSGVALAGALISLLTFSGKTGLRQNLLYRAVPATVLILGPSLLNLLGSGNGFPSTYLLLRTGLTIPALFCGAVIAAWLVLYRRRD